jgi:hypothetical protein
MVAPVLDTLLALQNGGGAADDALAGIPSDAVEVVLQGGELGYFDHAIIGHLVQPGGQRLHLISIAPYSAMPRPSVKRAETFIVFKDATALFPSLTVGHSCAHSFKEAMHSPSGESALTVR